MTSPRFSFSVFIGLTSLALAGPFSAFATVSNYQPDNLIGRKLANQKGDNIWNQSGAKQTVRKASKNGRKVKLFFKVDNDGNSPDDVRVKGTRADAGFKIKYFQVNAGGRQNVTRKVTSSKGLSVALPHDGEQQFFITIKPKGDAVQKGKSKTVNIKTVSKKDNTKSDTVKAKVKARK